MMKTIVMAVFVALTLGMADPVSAAHPLITDDTGTQGKGKFQIEMNGEYGADKETVEGVTVKETESEASATFSWGVTEDTDIVLGLPRRDFTIKENGAAIASESGLSDLSLEYKHRFFEKDGLSMAVKPGITLPTGGEERGLGTGKPSYGILFITTKEAGPWAIHANIGYTHNEYKLQADEDANKKGIWHASPCNGSRGCEGLEGGGEHRHGAERRQGLGLESGVSARRLHLLTKGEPRFRRGREDGAERC